MSRKVNSVSYRLGKRLCWSSIWSVKHTYFSSNFMNFWHYHQSVQYLFHCLNLNFNDLTVVCTNKSRLVFAKIFTNDNNTLFELVKTKSSLSSSKQKQFSRLISPISSIDNLSFNLFSINSNWLKYKSSAVTRSTSIGDENDMPSNSFIAILPVLNSQCVCNYISSQLLEQTSQKQFHFKQGLLVGIANFTANILRQLKLHNSAIILGLKVEITGRWKQTGSGRKQRIVLNIGSIKLQRLDQFVSFGFNTITTKFGLCTIKLWIAFKSS